MKIVIAGSGNTGSYLAKLLSAENQDVVLVSRDHESLVSLDSAYNILTMAGDPLSPSVLREAGVCDADLFVAMTPSQSDNLVACQLARSLGAKGSVARIENPEYTLPDTTLTMRDKGVDTMVLPELLAAAEIKEFISRNWMMNRFELNEDSLCMGRVKIMPGAPLDGLQLSSLQHHESMRRFHIAAISRNRSLIIPRGSDIIQRGDAAYITHLPQDEGEVARLTGHESLEIHNVMIAGAGKITMMLLRMLPPDLRVTVIDTDEDMCEALAAEFGDVTVVNADPRDIGVLYSEELPRMDIFIALTENAPTNIVGCMMARKSGVKRMVAQIEDLEYMQGAEDLGIDKVINKKLITSGHILRSILGTQVKVGRLISLDNADIAEIEVHEGARICKAPVRDLKLPKEFTIGGLIRNGEGVLVNGDTQIRPGDKVVVMFLQGALLKVRHWFR